MTTPAKPYVVLTFDDATSANTKPFATALHVPDSKTGNKSQWNTFLYVLSCTDGAKVTRWKVGQTYDANKSYGSKKRYCPWLTYVNEFQILHYGHALEMLVHRYFEQVAGQSINDSEWFANALSAVKTLRVALECNDLYLAETAHKMKNVSPCDIAFTCGMKAPLDHYLTLFRVSYRGKLFRLCEENIALPLGKMTAAKYEEGAKDATVAAELALTTTVESPPASPKKSASTSSGSSRSSE